MLGWEFPPLLTGGLGQACYSLAKALSQHTELQMIIPKADPQFIMDNVNLTGLNHISEKDIEIERLSYAIEDVQEIMYVPTDLTPYPVPIVKAVKKIKQMIEAYPLMRLEEIKELYGGEDNYGDNIMEKVSTYTELVLKLAENKEFDLIHTHDWLTLQAGVALKQKTQKPLIAHIHSLETDRVAGQWAKHPQNMVYQIELKGMRSADFVVPVSNYTKMQILQHYPQVAETKIVPIHNAIDPMPDAQPVALPDQTILDSPETLEEKGYIRKEQKANKMVLFLGRITYQKGPKFLVEAAEKLLKKDQNVTFIVAGSGDQQQWLQQEVVKRKIAENFVLTGFLSKQRVHELLEVADVYFMPSVSEPFGLSALEAAQHNVPSVISKQSGVAEVMQHALIADSGDAQKFANYLYALLHYEGIREYLTTETKKDLQTITWENVALQVLELYQKTIQSN